MVPTANYVGLSAILFVLGVIGVLTRRNAIIELVAELIEQLPATVALAETQAETETETSPAIPAEPALQMSVLFLPAADAADELAAQLLVRVLAPSEFSAEAVAATLKGEMLEQAALTQPDAICISATPPAALAHARYLCKKLRTRFPDVPIVVGLWDAQGDLQKATDRLSAVGAAKVVRSAAEAVEELSRLRQPLVQGVISNPAVNLTMATQAP